MSIINKSVISIENVKVNSVEISVNTIGTDVLKDKSSKELNEIKSKNDFDYSDCQKNLCDLSNDIVAIEKISKKYNDLEFRIELILNLYETEDSKSYVERFIIKDSSIIFEEKYELLEDISSCVTCGSDSDFYCYCLDSEVDFLKEKNTNLFTAPFISNHCKDCRCGEDSYFTKMKEI